MCWKRKQLQYIPLIPPICRPFKCMRGAEVEDYFQWYISHIKERIDYLSQISFVTLDYTPTSLVKIWKWFLKVARTQKMSDQDLQLKYREISAIDENLAKIVIEADKECLSLETEYIIRDIAMYLGEFFCVNHENIFWAYHTDTKKDSFANIPLLTGFVDNNFSPPFRADFEPNHMVGVQAARILRNASTSHDLLNIYNKWAKWAE